MSNKQIFKSPLLIIAFCCFLIAGATFLFTPKSQQTVGKRITEKRAPTVTVKPTQVSFPTESATSHYVAQRSIASTQIQIVSTQTPENHAQQIPTPTPQQQAPQKIHVTLMINGASVGTVDLPQGANQCDVLTQAKDQDKIASLLMKYDNSLGTNGVYQINGVGKENAIWWVYKVNGQSPSQGCSYIKATNGDTVVWEYKG